MSFNNSQSVDQVVERLQADNNVILKSESYPDNPLEYQLIHPKGVVLVAYRGSAYSPAAGGMKERKMKIICTVLLRNLRHSKEAESTLETVISSLAGWKHASWRQGLDIAEDRFIKESDGVWQYDIIFNLPTLQETLQHC